MRSGTCHINIRYWDIVNYFTGALFPVPCILLLWFIWDLFPFHFFNGIMYAHGFNEHSQIPDSSLYIFSPGPCFKSIFQKFSEKKKIQVNDLTSQIPYVPNWTWHFFVCPNGSLNYSLVYTSWNHFSFFLPFFKKTNLSWSFPVKWKSHFFSFLYTLAQAEEITCCNYCLLFVLLGVVIIKYKILWLSWQFVMLVPSWRLFLYSFSTKVFQKIGYSRQDFRYNLLWSIFCAVSRRWYPLSVIILRPCRGFLVGGASFLSPLTLSLPMWLTLSNEKWGKIQCACAERTWRSMVCFCSLFHALVLHHEKTSVVVFLWPDSWSERHLEQTWTGPLGAELLQEIWDKWANCACLPFVSCWDFKVVVYRRWLMDNNYGNQVFNNKPNYNSEVEFLPTCWALS